MKHVLTHILAAVLLTAMLVSCTGGSGAPTTGTGGSSKDLKPVKLSFMSVNGRETSRTEAILGEINKVLEEKLNVTLEFKTVEQEAYKIMLTGLENVDIIQTADYLAYYDNARDGAYMEIKLEDVQKYMPTWYKDNTDKLPSAMVDGKVYCIPGANALWNAPIMVLRKDWFPEGLTEVKTLDDLDKYFANVKKIKPEIMPYALDQSLTSWLTGAYASASTSLMAPGGPNCTSVVCFNKTEDPNYKLMRTWEQPQLSPFFKRIKEFADKGYWTPDVMNNPVNMNEAFQNSQSAVAWGTNIEAINTLYESMKQLSPEAELEVFDLGLENDIPADTYSPMGGAMAIPRAGKKNYERTLMLAELIYTDPAVYRLLRYGVEGEDYTVNEKGEVAIKDYENGLGYSSPYNNTDFDYLPVGGNWPGFEALKAQVGKRVQQNPFVGFGLDTTPVSDIANNLWNVHMEYAMPIYLGFVDDVDAAIAELNRQYELVGIDAYYDEAFKQLEAYLEMSGLTGYTISRAD